jgi:pyruvate carboxylase
VLRKVNRSLFSQVISAVINVFNTRPFKTTLLVHFTAMKMEMVVQSPRAGTIKTLTIQSGMKLEGEDLILTFE